MLVYAEKFILKFWNIPFTVLTIIGSITWIEKPSFQNPQSYLFMILVRMLSVSDYIVWNLGIWLLVVTDYWKGSETVPGRIAVLSNSLHRNSEDNHKKISE
jgi:hypothetical protein